MGRLSPASSSSSSFQHVLSILLFTWSLAVEGSNAFVVSSSSTVTSHYHSSLRRTPFIIQQLRAGGNGDNNNNNDNDANGAAADMNPINNGALVSTLAKLDQQWKIQQASPRAPKSRWSKLYLDKDHDDEEDYNNDDHEEQKCDPTTASDPFTPPPTTTSPFQQQQQQQQESLSSFVYVLEPKSSIPSCIVTFVGGAGLGQFPHIAYDQLLERLSDQLGGGAVIIAAPYSIGLDHFALAKQTGEAIRKGVLKYQSERNPYTSSSSTIPIYSLSHSLGCKLTTIYLAATQQNHDLKYKGIGFLAYNNFSFARTIGMARDFAQRLSKSSTTTASSSSSNLFNQLFTFAETAVDFMGLEFSPSPNDMKRLISMKYNTNDSPHDWKTRLFCFDDDTLDTTPEFVSAVMNNNNNNMNDNTDASSSSSRSVDVSYLPGNHLTPVYLQVRVQDYMSELPPEAQTVASEAMNGFQGISFGNEEDVTALVQELRNWIYGKEPTMRRRGRGQEEEEETTRMPLITGLSDTE